MATVKAVGLTAQDLIIVAAGCIIIFVVSILKEKNIKNKRGGSIKEHCT